MNVLIYDLETLMRMFLAVMYVPEEKRWWRFEISEWKNDLYAFIRFIESNEEIYWVGYNNLRFDAQVVEWIYRNYENWIDLTAEEIVLLIYQKAQDIIDDANYELFPEYREENLSLKQIDPFKINHYDNKNRMVSLKRLEFEMDMEDLEEMPIAHDKEDLSLEERIKIIEYCIKDVNATYKFWLTTIGQTEHPLYKDNNQVALRQDIEQEFGIKCLNFSDSKIGDEMIKKFYCQEKRISINQLPRKGTFRKEIKVSNCIAKYIKFQTKELKDFHKRIKDVTLTMKDEFKESLSFYGMTYSFMKGGLHSENKPEIFEEDDDYFIIDWDVASYYPAIIINNKRYPVHLGPEFLRGYKQMFDRRLELKPLAEDDKRIKGIVGALKLAVNSVYGKSSDMQSWMYDRQLTMFTTITGELSLMMLIEAYELAEIHAISANTDGVTIKVHKDKINEMFKINNWWCEITGYVLERTDYKKIIFSTVNDYIAIKTNGKVKKKGDFLTDFELHKNKSARIVPLALEKYYTEGIPVEETIKNHKNIYDFALRQKASKNFHYEGVIVNTTSPSESYIQEEIKTNWKKQVYWDRKYYWLKNNQEQNDHWGGYTEKEMIDIIIKEWKSETGKKSIYNKLIRYYVSKTGEKILKVKNPECTTNAAPVSQVHAGEWLCTVVNKLPASHPLDNINYNFYIERAMRIIDKITYGGKKHKPRDLNQLTLF